MQFGIHICAEIKTRYVLIERLPNGLYMMQYFNRRPEKSSAGYFATEQHVILYNKHISLFLVLSRYEFLRAVIRLAMGSPRRKRTGR